MISGFRSSCVALLSVSTAIVGVSSFAGLHSLKQSGKSQVVVCRAQNDNVECDRRREMVKGAISFLGVAATLPNNANAESLLDAYGDSSNKNKNQKAVAAAKEKPASNLEPNLRSNYYYPTNKKRYLPRIKKCNDAIPAAAESIGTEDWESAELFAVKIADDTVLPLKLYTSSLLGGGTNVKVTFAETMKKSASDFEKAQKKLVKAIAKKDQEKSSKALEEMSSALLAYRTAGRLLGPDGGGDIPSVDEIRRSACRVQGRSFEMKIKDRDARLKAAS